MFNKHGAIIEGLHNNRSVYSINEARSSKKKIKLEYVVGCDEDFSDNVIKLVVGIGPSYRTKDIKLGNKVLKEETYEVEVDKKTGKYEDTSGKIDSISFFIKNFEGEMKKHNSRMIKHGDRGMVTDGIDYYGFELFITGEEYYKEIKNTLKKYRLI